MGVYRRIPAVCILMDLQRVAMNVRNDGVSTTEILWRPGTMLVSEITTMNVGNNGAGVRSVVTNVRICSMCACLWKGGAS